MYSLIISCSVGVATLLVFGLTEFANWVWASVWGVVAFLASNGIIGYFIGKKIKALMMEMQGIMMQGQRAMQEKTQAWRFRPPGSIRQAQIELQKMQHGFIVKALDFSSSLDRFKGWSPLLGRQLATMRMQLYFQDKNFKEVDALLPKCLIIDPMTSAIVIARLYMRDGYTHEKDKKGNDMPNAIDKHFSKGIARLRYGQGALLYGLYAWIKMQKNDVDGAFDILLRATKKMENDCIKYNIDLLKNNKPKQFSLAGLGDEWYALGLEEPRVKMQRQQRPF